MDEFKEFLKTVPSVKQDVLNGRYTWQQLYEIYVMYGKDDKFWQPYKTNSNVDLNAIIEIIKEVVPITYGCEVIFEVFPEPVFVEEERLNG